MNPFLLVPALSPLAKAAFVVALALGGYLYGRLHEARAHEARLAEFVAEVAAQGAEQAKRTAARIAQQVEITRTKEIEHAEELLHALDAGWRERLRAVAAAGGRRLPAVPGPAAGADGAPADQVAARPSAGPYAPELDLELDQARRAFWDLAEGCTATTLMLTNLQEWVEEQRK